MRFGTVNMSDVVASGRLDAGFHLTASEHREDVAKLRAVMTEDEARDLVLSLPHGVLNTQVDGKQVLAPLCRGSTGGRATSVTLLRIASEYPHLSIAILASHVDIAIESAREEVAAIEKRIGTMQGLKDILA